MRLSKLNIPNSPFAPVHSRAFRSIATLVSIAVAWTPWALVWGDDLANQGRQGQAFGSDQATAFAVPELIGDQMNLSVQGNSESIRLDSLFPGSASGQSTDFSAFYGDAAALGAQGQAVQSDLLSAGSDHSEAFQTLHGSFGVSDRDLLADPLWQQTDSLLDDMAGMTEAFTDCSVESEFASSTRTVHLPEIQTCQRVQQGGSCVIRHAYQLPTAETSVTVSGGAELSSCGNGCLEVTFDFPGVDPVPSCPTCGFLPPQGFGFGISEPERVVRIGVSVDPGAPYVSRADQAWSMSFPGYSATVPETLQDREETTALQAGGQFLIANGYRFQDAGSQWFVGQAPYAVRIQITLTPNPVMDSGWDATPACLQLARIIRDQAFCNGSAVCSGAPLLDSDGCYTDLGVRICPADFALSPVPWLSPFCQEITISADCAGFNAGPMQCWTDPQGNIQCPYNTGDIADNCDSLEANPDCFFLESECVAGATDDNGVCYVTESRYDCGTNQEIPAITRESSAECAGPVRCLGEDCLDLTFEQSDDFAEAAAALQAAQFVAMDSDCTSPGTCQVFKGEASECKQAVGGVVDCCKNPAGVSLLDYIQLIFAVSKVDSAIMASEAGSTLRGSWELLRDPLVDSWDAVTDAFTTAANNLIGRSAASASEGAAKLSLDAVKQALMRQTAEWVANIFGDAAANALFVVEGGGPAVIGGAVQTGHIQLGGLVGTTLSWVMTAYMIYSVAMILIRLIWTCEEDEFTLGAKRELRSCHYVGSYCDSEFLGICIEKQKAYCCFNTPLARIINEQAYPQLGRGWGEPEYPDCSGLSLHELERLDWNRIDLSEWLAILTQTGQYPSAANLDIESLTGLGSDISLGDRDNAAERSVERAQGIDGAQAAQDAAETLRDDIRQTLP